MADLRERGTPPTGAWEAVLASLEPLINAHSFDTWFRPTVELGVVTDGEGERLVVELPNDMFRSWVTRNYREVIDQACKAAGVTAGLTFVTRDETALDEGGRSER